MTKGKFRPEIFLPLVWVHFMAFVVMPWYFVTHAATWWDVLWKVLWQMPMFVIMYKLRALGISVGYHRYFTHHSFKCKPWFKFVLAFKAALAVQGPIGEWVTNHDQHHWATEGPWDPHSPLKYSGQKYGRLKGFWWAHVFWTFSEVLRPSESFVAISLRKNADMVKWDRLVYPLGVITSFALPFAIQGWAGLLFSGFFGVVVTWHITWSINSICHLFGDDSVQLGKDKGNNSRNNILLAWLTIIGEPFHRNHHEKPDWAHFGWHWHSPDMGKWYLDVLEGRGVVWDVKKATPEMLAAYTGA